MSATAAPSLRGWQITALLLLAVIGAVFALSFQHFLPERIIKLGVAGAAACVFALAVASYPKAGLLIAIFWVLAGLTYYAGVGAGYPIVVLVIGGTAFKILKGERVIYPTPMFNWMVGLFLAFAIQSVIFAWSLSHASSEILRFFRSIILVYLAVHLIRTPRDMDRFGLTIFVSAFVAVVLGIMNFMFGWVKSVAIAGGYSGVVRFGATHGDPNAFAVLLVSALPFGIFALRRARGVVPRVVVVAVLLLIVLAVFSTFSRAAVFPLAFVALAVLLRDGRNKWGLLVVSAAVAATVLVVPLQFWQRLISLGEVASAVTIDWSLQLRIWALKTAWKLFTENPITGVGIGNFIVREAPYFWFHRVAHNAYLEVAVGVGIFGFGAWLAAILVALSESIRAVRWRWRAEFAWMPHLAFSAGLSLVASMMGVVFLSMPFDYIIWLPVAGCLICGGLARRFANPREIAETPSPPLE